MPTKKVLLAASAADVDDCLVDSVVFAIDGPVLSFGANDDDGDDDDATAGTGGACFPPGDDP